MTYGGWGDGGGMRAREKACKSITKLVDTHGWWIVLATYETAI